MSSHKSLHVRQFQRAAQQRLKEARFLLQHGFNTIAVYLGGHAVECILKAVVLAHTPASQQADMVRSFRGRIAHNFDWLRNELRRRHVTLPTSVIEHLTMVTNEWSTHLRYSVDIIDRGMAQAFLASADHLVRWAEGRL